MYATYLLRLTQARLSSTIVELVPAVKPAWAEGILSLFSDSSRLRDLLDESRRLEIHITRLIPSSVHAARSSHGTSKAVSRVSPRDVSLKRDT